MFTSKQIQCIVDAIHKPRPDGSMPAGVRLSGKVYPIRITPKSNCRYIKYEDKLKFVEQNQNEKVTTELADLARAGNSVIHVVRLTRRGPWGTIVNGEVIKPIPVI